MEKANKEIEQISAFKCSDGEVFEEKSDASHHQCEINAKEAVENFVEENCYNGMRKDDVVEFLLNNREELIEILKG